MILYFVVQNFVNTVIYFDMYQCNEVNIYLFIFYSGRANIYIYKHSIKLIDVGIIIWHIQKIIKTHITPDLITDYMYITVGNYQHSSYYHRHTISQKKSHLYLGLPIKANLKFAYFQWGL